MNNRTLITILIGTAVLAAGAYLLYQKFGKGKDDDPEQLKPEPVTTADTQTLKKIEIVSDPTIK